MALLTEKAPVNYEEQEGLCIWQNTACTWLTNTALAAFVDFLQNFKSSSTEAADQLENLNLNGDGEEAEYDMVDDSDDPAPQGRRRTKAKYMEMLQDIADRTRTNVLIDLNDLETVRMSRIRNKSGANTWEVGESRRS